MLERLKGSKPWFVMGAITYLEDEFLEDPYGELTFKSFEWGCGGSTLWLSQRTKSVVTLEHDREWVESTRAELDKYGITNVSLVLKFLDRGYVEYIDTFPDEHFDIIMVDGRRRSDCLRHAIPKLRCGGALVLDNSERAEYQEAMNAVNHWHRLDWDSGYSEGWMTTVWRKPQ
jgi:predicted O-methyltransferase YrrM